jgi:hypothetical protein
LANIFISRAGDSRYPALVPWAQPLCFILLFVLAFAILQTITARLTRQPIDLGLWPERIGRSACGIFTGLIASGLLLTALAMAPLPNNYPYQRFDQTNPNPQKPNKVLLNADGFATGWFSIISRASFSGKKSFATLHPNFLNQLFLNRHKIANDISVVTDTDAIEIPRKTAAWPAPADLKDSDGKPLPPKSGHNLIIVRVGIKKKAITKNIKNAGEFTLSQLRLLCKQKTNAEKPLAGKAKPVYPIGYLTTANQLQLQRLSDTIKIKRDDFEEPVRWIDFAFYVPDGFTPVLIEFKQNCVASVPPPVTPEQALPAVPFIQPSEAKKDVTEPNEPDKPSQPRSSKSPEQPETPSGKSGLSDFSRSVIGDQLEEDE